jgi:hypothetical protein
LEPARHLGVDRSGPFRVPGTVIPPGDILQFVERELRVVVAVLD